ncbi:MAG: hypothetical protein E7042_06205 [Lentisphaerae bacterium]|nr:hypothetical protein [Lentisphaerota bacterium]
MNKKICTLIAVFSAVALFASTPATKSDMQFALDKVDQGGEYLFVSSSVQEYVKFLEELPPSRKVEVRLQQLILRTMYRVIGMNLVKAQATSSKEVAPGCWVYKSYHYLGRKNMQLPSIFSCMGNSNRKLDLANLPANTLAAASIDIDFGAIYNLLSRELSSIDELKNVLPAMEESAKQQGIDVKKLTASINGTFKFCIAGTTPADLAIRIDIPDRNGEVSAFIRKSLRLAPDAGETTLPLFFMPVKVKFNNRNITISNQNQLSAAAGTLGQVPAFANYISRIGDIGDSYALVNLNQQMINTINAMLPPELRKTLTLVPVSALLIGRNDQDGILAIGAANFSGTKMVTVGTTSILTGMLIPALKTARDRGQQVNCIHNLKLIATALAMYACDNKDALPAGNGIRGLQELVDKEYITIEDFSCRAKPIVYPDKKLTAACPYIYIGGIYGKITPDGVNLPVIFEKPGFHPHTKHVNVAFADGHVESVIVDNYNTPAQVIGALNVKHKYPAELLDKMVRAVAEN